MAGGIHRASSLDGHRRGDPGAAGTGSASLRHGVRRGAVGGRASPPAPRAVLSAFRPATRRWLFYLREGWVDGRALTAKLVGDALRRGAHAAFGTAACDIVTAQGRITRVVTSDGERHQVDAVVNAAGPDGDKVAALAGRALPMRYEPGLVARLALRQCSDPPRAARSARRATARRPRTGGAAQPGDRQPAERRTISSRRPWLQDLHALAVDAVPALTGSALVGARAMSRPIPADGFPSVGGAR